MDQPESADLAHAVRLRPDQILNPELASGVDWDPESPVLVVLAAGMGKRFGQEPKCIQPVGEVPLARHSINAFRTLSSAASVCLVGYEFRRVAQALGDDNLHVRSQNPTGGTAFAAYEAFAVEALESVNPVLVITMGDRIVPPAVFDQLLSEHRRDSEAELTMLTASYQPPAQHGKGRVVRDSDRTIVRIVEQPDIDKMPPGIDRDQLQDHSEGNCPLYAIRAATLKRYLGQVQSGNAQNQFYFTDIVEAIRGDGGLVRSVTISPDDPSYEILCADVTNRDDLRRLAAVYRQYQDRSNPETNGRDNPVRQAAKKIAASRPPGQIESIANQIEAMICSAESDDDIRLSDEAVAIGISGGRLRIAFMHPDMERFFGPAWQMPIGAPDASGREQIVVLMQASADRRVDLWPTNPAFREQHNSIEADADYMFPGAEVNDIHQYESFGTHMAQRILTQLGYVTDEQIAALRELGKPLPPESNWVVNSMRRPFSLLANAVASIRTIGGGDVGRRVQRFLSRENFGGLKVLSSGDIPRGGFSSSSAVTVAVQNAVNSLFDLRIKDDHLVDLACQAEFGTGVRAGALDQATEQMGTANQGALISSNPRENYRILKTFPVPADRFRVLFPFSVDRDREAWRWSMGLYAQTGGGPRLTTSETRKMTGKAAEIAALLLNLPIDHDFFPEIEAELVGDGELTTSTALHVRDRLKAIPRCIRQAELRDELDQRLPWYADQLITHRGMRAAPARALAATTFESLLSGWRDPLLSRSVSGRLIEEVGAPLRAMVGYLYGEVTKNCYLVHHPEQWIQCVTDSQRGDRCFDIDPKTLPDKNTMLREGDWEKSASGSELMQCWLERFGAEPFDFNADLEASALAREDWNPRTLGGTNFFRGLPLIDLAEAMLKRAFGGDAVAVRVNGAGQGDYFQVHVDTTMADPEEVKQFIRGAFYERFGLSPEKEFVEPHPGGGAVGVRLHRYGQLPMLVSELRTQAATLRSAEHEAGTLSAARR